VWQDGTTTTITVSYTYSKLTDLQTSDTITLYQSTCCTIKVSCGVTFVLKEHKYKFALHCGIYCILKIPHYTLYTFSFFTHVTESFVMLEVTITFLEGGGSLTNISSFYSLCYIPGFKHAVSVVPMKCLHTATSVISVCSLAKEFGGLCLP
jgi:hypothetical protein